MREEPVLRDWKDEQGGLTAAITRNSYGCLVLNTAQIMFVDVDAPEPKSSGGGFFAGLFGKEKTGADRKSIAGRTAGESAANSAANSRLGMAGLQDAGGIPVDGHP